MERWDSRSADLDLSPGSSRGRAVDGFPIHKWRRESMAIISPALFRYRSNFRHNLESIDTRSKDSEAAWSPSGGDPVPGSFGIPIDVCETIWLRTLFRPIRLGPNCGLEVSAN